jgi:anti-anti-sigma factor
LRAFQYNVPPPATPDRRRSGSGWLANARYGYSFQVIRVSRLRAARRRVSVPPGYARDVESAGDVRTEPAGDAVDVVVLSGEHDLGTVPVVREALDAAAAAEKAVLIDLCNATFVDSSLLGAVLESRRLAIEAGRGFAVACTGEAEPVRRVLEVTGLAEELPVHATRAEALAALDNSGSP